jgi:tRNA(Arg) A34 adenosine deaminase TadA
VPEIKSPKKDARPPDKLDNRTDKRDDGPKTTKETPKVKRNHPLFPELEGHAKKRAAELKATMSNRKRGPVLTVLKDKKTGKLFEGLNDKQVPSELHPILKKRLDKFHEKYPSKKDWPHPSDPGTHSEIYAIDKALKAREAAGMKVTEKSLKDFTLYNETLWKKKTGSVPCCANCTRLIDGVESLSGKLRTFHGPK